MISSCAEKQKIEAEITANNGKDGATCESFREDSNKRVRIVCTKDKDITSLTYVYDGINGASGSSCSAVPAIGGMNVTCGSNPPVYLANGANGMNGKDAITPGLSCNVHNLSNWNGVTNILTVLSASAPVGTFTLPNLSVGNSQSANGFPGMPAALQSAVGLDGYALDCNGYINIETSGMYEFSSLNDDGMRLVIDNNVIINSPALQAPTVNTSKYVELQRGNRAFNVIYYQGPHTQIALRLSYQGPNTPSQVVPASRFTN